MLAIRFRSNRAFEALSILKLMLVVALAMAMLAPAATAGTLTNVSLSVADSAVGASSNITIAYTTATALSANQQLLYATLPAGFVLTNSFTAGFCAANMTLTLDGTPTAITGGGINSDICGTFSGNSVQINTGIAIAAGTVVSVTINSSIAQNPSTPGVKTMTLFRTGTQGGAAIDTPATLPSVTIGGVSLPTITGLSPASGPTAGGTTVTITGTGFTGATAVQFGGAPADSFSVVSDTSITATSPAGAAGSVSVRVTTPSGMNDTSAADQFTYTSTPADVPTLSEWAMILLGLLLAAAGYRALTRQSPVLNG